jgi:hypothetical protein
MVIRVLVLLSALAAVFATATPAAAAAGQTTSQTFHFTSMPMSAAPLPCGPAAGLVVVNEDNGNGVIHQTFNNQGFWGTGTYTGDVKIMPALSVTLDSLGNVATFVPDPTRPTAQGSVTDWFGFNVNVGNTASPMLSAVGSDTINAQVTTSGGASLSFHLNDHVQLDILTETITHTFSDARCF